MYVFSRKSPFLRTPPLALKVIFATQKRTHLYKITGTKIKIIFLIYNDYLACKIQVNMRLIAQIFCRGANFKPFSSHNLWFSKIFNFSKLTATYKIEKHVFSEEILLLIYSNSILESF